jgi:hypothetical protein
MPRKTTGSPVMQASAAHARAVRSGTAAEVAAARAALAAAKIEDSIERALADAPPLTGEQAARIARLLTADGGRDQ